MSRTRGGKAGCRLGASLRDRSCAGVLALLVFLAGCSTTYHPQIRPKESRQTVPAIAELHPFEAAPGLRSGHEHYGVVADGVRPAKPSELTEAITEAIRSDLGENRVFTQVVAYHEHPDLVLTGQIGRFYEHYRPQIWTLIPWASQLAWLFGANTYQTDGAVDLTLIALSPDGQVLGRYRDKETFGETLTPNKENGPGVRLNQALTEAVHQIRQQLVENQSALLRAERTQTP